MGFSDLYYPWGFILQALALIHFFRRRPEFFWLWVILIFGALGALIYFVVEVLPDVDLLRARFRRASRRKRLQALEAIVQENPAVGNLEELADLSFEEGQFARARELYDRVLGTSRPTSVDPFYRRGLSALALGDAPAAVADLERVVAEEPKYDLYRAAGMLASAYALAGQPDRAEQQFKAATSVSTLSETYYNYAAFLLDQNRRDEAREWAERILAKKPTMPRFAQRRERPWFQKAKALVKKARVAAVLLALALAADVPVFAQQPAGESPRLRRGYETRALTWSYGHSWRLGWPGYGKQRTHMQFVGFHPQLGWFLTSRLELTGEGTLQLYWEPGAAIFAGIMGLAGRYHFWDNRSWTPYVHVGSGLGWTSLEVVEIDRLFNFQIAWGAGLRQITRKGPGWLIEFRNHHISNAGTRGGNIGVNAATLVVGMHWVLRPN